MPWVIALIFGERPAPVAKAKPTQGDEAQIFHLRGECNQLAKSLFQKIEENADSNCIENFFDASNYNTKDNVAILR